MFELFISNYIIYDNNYRITSQVINAELKELTLLLFKHILHYCNINIDDLSLLNEKIITIIMKCLGNFRIWYLSKNNEERNQINDYVTNLFSFMNENVDVYKMNGVSEDYVDFVCNITLKIIQNEVSGDEIMNYLQINEEYSKLYIFYCFFIIYFDRRSNVLNDLYRITTDREINLTNSFYTSLFKYILIYYIFVLYK